MVKYTSYLIFLILFFTSCNYFDFRSKEEESQEVVAIVNNEKLFKDDIKAFLPEKISKNDSILLVRSFINNWALKKLLLNKAEKNNSLEATNEINTLVNDYRESLLINNYKEMLINQQLDTVIFSSEIDLFYENNKENFKLNEELLKIKYLHFDHKVVNKKELIRLFKSEKIDDLESLEKQQLSFKKFQFNENIWISLDKVMINLPFSKEELLNKTKYLEKQDSIGLYLVSVKDFLSTNETAPLSYIKSQIKQMILHRRKIKLIKDIEKILIQDATKNNNFKIY
ncbi:MAG: hypothetical protein GW772_11305 [Flavobacteriia bacterium]|nr:hypothetical protein [Flavobacteriia bacterium]PIV96984.1 MAG: hypothetical protein COW43_05410 [Flavobacteriaceae bacterium CG17_big_fil_post_rev_8_21_14_2_50_31_13]PIX12574.1 MAG: hypothetical protein COZ74_10785 [Flavobacteriaceae bacterium CG_4_8_14_3_um_filter_31_8]PIY15161.1 MAG: hypothetical protein COZ16_05460 [Flavobacteriaceae bacterium CG_4_10_14_3_um_filter_31_253]PIZ09487.1 MAG: hypothetical protein COY55_12570 [Flavobacteriaceae bacterium CG_4_10_14_0_8_um_filter_31_99]PJC1004